MTVHPQVKRGPNGRRKGLDVKLGRADVALAYELRQEGVSMALIADTFDCDPSHFSRLFARCERDGLGWLLKP